MTQITLRKLHSVKFRVKSQLQKMQIESKWHNANERRYSTIDQARDKIKKLLEKKKNRKYEFIIISTYQFKSKK